MNGRPGVIVQVSSAKQFVGQDVLDVTELMKRMKSVGLRGEPWGTPAVGEPGLFSQCFRAPSPNTTERSQSINGHQSRKRNFGHQSLISCA